MKKITVSLITAATLFYSNLGFSEWNGFYLGGNLGYWQSQTNKITTTGSVNFINQAYEPGASNIANALAQTATNHFSFHPDGLIGGGQIGYNYQSSERILLGLNIDFDGLTNSSNNYALQKYVRLADFDETYIGSLNIKQKINYLGTIRARLGYLFCPTILVYATGGFAYGNVTLNTAWTAQESLGPEVFPTIATHKNSSKTLTGWTAGAGVEWLFKPNWSASFEYNYYDLNDLNTSTNLAQLNTSTSPAELWGSVNANADLSLAVGMVRLGVNYHFA